jgi:glutathione S-transferase
MYKLYNVQAWGSLAIDCLLGEMGVPYESVWMTAEQVKAPEFRKLSPLGLIPALGLPDGRTLYESAAIVSFLIAAHPEKRMSPPIGSGAYGEFMSLLHLMSTDIYPTMSLCFSGSGYGETPAQDAFIAARALERSDGYWRLLEQRLATSGPWLMGADFSALDLYVFMLSVWGRPSEDSFHQRFPAVARLAGEVRARPRLLPVLEAHRVMNLGGYGS